MKTWLNEVENRSPTTTSRTIPCWLSVSSRCSQANRSHWPGSGQYAIIDLPVGPITLARGRLQATSIQDRDRAAVITDEGLVLQRCRGLGDADSTNTEHVPEKLVSEINGVGVRAVLGHQEPASETRLDHMEPRTGRRLCELAHQHIKIAMQTAVE